MRTKCACRPVRVRVLLVRYHIAKRKTLVLVVGVEGSQLLRVAYAPSALDLGLWSLASELWTLGAGLRALESEISLL